MRTTSALSTLAAALLLPLSACGGDAADEAAPAQAPAAAETPAPQGMALSFSPSRDSGVTGTGRVVHEGESVTLTVELSGLPGEGSYNAHIHTGTCAEIGGVAVRLNPVEGQAGGSGSASTSFPAADLPAEGNTLVQVHGADGPGIACADIMDHAM